MEKKICQVIVMCALFTFSACNSAKKQDRTNKSGDIQATDTERVVNEDIRFCESTYPYQGGVLIANFGTEQLNPLNTEGKGYILFYKDSTMSELIPADGNLSAPKGMYEKDDYLFICDVNKIVVYNLKDLRMAPQIIQFPKEDLFINDLAVSGNELYASVTNTGRIYRMSISDMTQVGQLKPTVWCEVAGPNGLVIDGHSMYVASYPADGNTTADNVVYVIPDLSQPRPEKLITEAGQYDGLALSADKKTLYVTNWMPAGVYAIDMDTHSIAPLKMKTEVGGAADMTLSGDRLYIPDLPNSRVVILPLGSTLE